MIIILKGLNDFICVLKYFLNILSKLQQYHNNNDNHDNFCHNNRDMKFSSRYIPTTN